MKRSSSNRTWTVLSLLSVVMWSAIARAQVGIGVSITLAPPELPVYVQPAIPAPGYLWAPGYWAWGDGDYYWVPGTWVQAPQPGFLWTPGYWGWSDGNYLWHEGYWGPHVGFYGGVHYGFGYTGTGYAGGYWQGGAFFYNRSVNNIPANVRITNVYSKTVINTVSVHSVSYNGGAGGTAAQPTAAELAAVHEQHLPPVAAQAQQRQVAGANPALRAATNHGHPPIAATAHPGVLKGPGVVAAHGALRELHPVANVPAHTVPARPAEPSRLTEPSRTAEAPRPAEPPKPAESPKPPRPTTHPEERRRPEG